MTFYLDNVLNAGRIADTQRFAEATPDMTEAILVFLPLALLAVHYDLTNGLALWGAITFFLARVLYIPAYITAVSLTRSVVWTIGHIGLGMMAFAVIAAAY